MDRLLEERPGDRQSESWDTAGGPPVSDDPDGPDGSPGRDDAGFSRRLVHVLLFIVRRLGISLLALFGLSVVIFLATHIHASAATFLPETASQQQVDALNHRLGYDQPLIVQFWHHLVGIAHLDFGTSLWSAGVPAFDLASERLIATLQLGAATILIVVLVFIPLGVLASLRPNGIVDRIVLALSAVGISMPTFWIGAMAILIFSVRLEWFPTSGYGSLAHVVLPAVTMAIGHGARIAQVTRTTMITQLNSPYVQGLRGRGFSLREIVPRNVLRNTALPVGSIFFWEASLIVGSTVTVETVFAWPGLGQLTIQALRNNDEVLLQATVLTLGALVVVVNLVGDLVLRLADPRAVLS